MSLSNLRILIHCEEDDLMGNLMGNVYSFWELTLIPKVEQFYNNEYLMAIRRTFYILIPFWLTISALDVINNLLLNPKGFLMSNQGLNLGFWLTGGLSGEDYLSSDFARVLMTYNEIVDIGYRIITILIVSILSRYLADIFESDKYLTIFCSLAAFLIMSSVPNHNVGEMNDYFSRRGYFLAFSTAFASSWIFAKLSTIKRLQIKAPSSTSKEFSQYISKTPAIFLTLLTASACSLILALFSNTASEFEAYLSSLDLFQEPIFVAIYQFTVWFLWWLGLPGYAITSKIMEVGYIPAQISNQIGETSAIFTTGFFEAGVIHVMGFMIAILVFSQHDSWRSVSKFSLPAMFFNVQEVFIFGLPVVLNPIFLVPYIFAPIANVLVGYFAISWGIVPIFQVDIPWTMPLILSAAIGTHSIMGGILQIVWLIMDIFIYAPFVITANAIELKNE